MTKSLWASFLIVVLGASAFGQSTDVRSGYRESHGSSGSSLTIQDHQEYLADDAGQDSCRGYALPGIERQDRIGYWILGAIDRLFSESEIKNSSAKRGGVATAVENFCKENPDVHIAKATALVFLRVRKNPNSKEFNPFFNVEPADFREKKCDFFERAESQEWKGYINQWVLGYDYESKRLDDGKFQILVTNLKSQGTVDNVVSRCNQKGNNPRLPQVADSLIETLQNIKK